MSAAASPASLFATIAIAHALAVASPGPDLAVVTRQTLAHGRAAGLRTALGIACGITVHVGYALFGLAWAMARMPSLLGLLQGLGAALLLWMGWRALRAPRPLAEAAPPAEAADAPPARHDFLIGLGTNVLNVKAGVFFVALCSAAIGSDTPAWLRLALGGWMVLATGAWFSLIAWTLGHDAIRRRLARQAWKIDRAMGALLVLLALALLVSLLPG